MKTVFRMMITVFFGIQLVGCSTLDPMKERKDGNVVQVHSIKHVRSGRLMNDATAISAANAGVVTSQLGGTAGASLAAGGAMIAIQGIVNALSEDDEYYVAVTRPDDLVPNLIGKPSKLVNPLGAVKMTPSMNGVKIGEWVKVKKERDYYTLVRCVLPGANCKVPSETIPPLESRSSGS